MNRQYSETFIVRATDSDVQRRMRPAALFVAMQEGGERHAITLGAGYDAMMARGLFFALTRIHVRFVRAPRCGERVAAGQHLGVLRLETVAHEIAVKDRCVRIRSGVGR